MNISDCERVNNFLSDIQSISTDQFDIIVSIRDIFLSENKELTEDIKYGGLVFNASNSLIGGIYTYKKHISIEFSNGADFIDSDSILEGNGKKRRHLKIHTGQDIAEKNVAYFVNQAVNR